MTTLIKVWIAISLSLFFFTSKSQDIEHQVINSFDGAVPSFVSSSDGIKLKSTDKHFKHGHKSLEWPWQGGEKLWFNTSIGFQPFVENKKDQSISTFVFWVYNEKPLNSELKFNFKTGAETNCWFSYSLNFSGWRGAWVAFERDMQGVPLTTMNKLEIEAPETGSGSLFFDLLILSIPADVRWHTADFQAPFINPETKNHWLQLYNSSQNQFDLPVASGITESEKKHLNVIEERFEAELLHSVKVDAKKINQIREKFKSYEIRERDGLITGKAIWFSRFTEVYHTLDVDWKDFYDQYGKEIRSYSAVMYEIAQAYHSSSVLSVKSELKSMFLKMTRHMFDQGWQAGSAMGTLHHLGYNVRDFYSSLFLMRRELSEAGLKVQAQQAMEWFSGVGEVKKAPLAKGISIDAFNTSVMGRLASILMLPDSPEKVTYLHSFSRYIDNGLQFADGLEDSFKPDGSIFHHGNHYPAYATGGLDGAVNMVWFLNNTDFEVSRTGHEILKNSLLKFRLYCNLKQWPLSISGRHPKGTGSLIPWHFARLAMCGTVDKSSPIDKELASAYLRLTASDKNDSYKEAFSAAGISAEPEPQGNWPMNYACLGIHWRDNWLATVRGHSRYLWAAETYLDANWFGRYLAHGHLQIMAGGTPVSNQGSGYQQLGWDWNRWPGTTVINLPLEKLKADVQNVDRFSGYEEMLFSDESFAGAISFDQKQGMYAFKLHEHDKYNGSHRALKSYFFFDKRIICLGSDIENDNPDFPTETVLFQNVLNEKEDLLVVNGQNYAEFPFVSNDKGETMVHLRDNQQMDYWIEKGNEVLAEKKHQYSLDQSSCKLTEGNFMSAVISHGKAPKDARYEYLIAVKLDEKDRTALTDAMQNGRKPYTVLQQNKQAHMVVDEATQITACALFEAGNIPGNRVVQSSSLPVLLMFREQGDRLELSACDPDLHLYEGPADVTLDENGKRIERSIYSYPWYYSPSNASKAVIRLKGKWQVSGESEYFKVIVTNNESTDIEISFQHALTRETVLTRL